MLVRGDEANDGVAQYDDSFSDVSGDSPLHERVNWPFPESTERSSSPDTVVSVGDSEGAQLHQNNGAITDAMGSPSDIPDVRLSNTDEKPRSQPEIYADETSSPRPVGGSTSSTPDSDLYAEDPRGPTNQADKSRPQHDSGIGSETVLRNDGDETQSVMISPEEQPMHVQGDGQLQESSAAQSVSSRHSEQYDEGRDVATPIQFVADNNSESFPSPSSPPGYGRSTPTSNGTLRRSSIVKSTPPSRSASRRSQQITPLRDRLRYSWQSMQDEEPNRPRIHIIKLISNTATASAGFPQGEALGFSLSPGGRRLAAFNSARLYVLQTAALPVGISQDFALKRRPLAVEIVDEGNMLAILADEHTVNIYDLAHQQLKRIRTIKTDFPTNCIALSPTGALLAAAYEGGVEIFSLAKGALPTDRRAVRCPKMDRLAFSEDSSTLLGTTVRINVSSTMTVSVPVFPASSSDVPTHEELKEAWCSELLHPENIRNSSHAIFMRENRETCNDRLFAWNGLEDTFGILNINDMVYGAIDFPVVISPPLSTCGGLGAAIHSPPAMDEHGDTVAMIVNDRTIRLYIVPHKNDEEGSTVEAHSIDHELDEGYGCPFTEVRWVYSSSSLPAPPTNQTHVQGRLIVASPGGVVEQSLNDEPVDDVEGGRIIMFDFDPQFAGQPGQTFSLTLGKSQPQLLEEPEIDVAEEVALVRRRTVNQNKGGLSSRPVTLGRAASTVGRRDERSIRIGTPNLSSRTLRNSLLSLQSDVSRSLPDLMESSEALDTFEEPYALGAPRSQASLQRAASNAQRHRFQTIEERNQERVSVDSTGNFLALPEYTEEPNAPLPHRFRALAGLDHPAPAPATKPAVITNADGDRQSPISSAPSTAPAAIAENFDSDRAFDTANLQMQTQGLPAVSSTITNGAQPSPTASSPSPVGGGFGAVSRSATFDSLASMPRGLQRAYGNAPSGMGLPSTLGGDWENVSPILGPGSGRPFSPQSPSSPMSSGGLSPAATASGSHTLDGSLPVALPRHPASSPFGRATQNSSSYRFSTSQLNPPGHFTPPRSPPGGSSFGAGGDTSPTSTASSRTRRLPPHTQAFRNVLSNNSSASLFPPNQPADHVPIRETAASIGSVPHPVTAWHPPQASSTRGHSRKSSISNRSAFASTEKARKLGFFRAGTKKRKKQPLYGPEFTPGGGAPRSGGGGDASMMETKSMFTTMTRGEGKCAVM